MPRILRLIGSISVVVMLVAWGVEPRTARADDCLAQPNSSAPAGNHWYYHTDRATQRKCWYLRALDQPAQQPTAQATSQATPTDPIPLEESAASGGVPISAPPGASTSSLPHIKMLSVVPDPLTPPMAIVQAPIATQTAAQTEGTSTESVQPTSDARAPADDAQDAAQATASPNGAGGANVVVSVPVEMSLVAALGLVVAGFLFRIAMTARRRRIFTTQPKPEEAIAKLGRQPGGGLIVPPDAFTIVHDQLLVRLAQQHGVPAVYSYRQSVAQGGLMSYGPDPFDNFRRSASYVDRILKGAKPADLPVQQPTKFELIINLKTAKTLGLDVPRALLARADEVIE
jgi:hypothetical protein